jgi:hypothetical protein
MQWQTFSAIAMSFGSPESSNAPKMTGDESRKLNVGDRVSWHCTIKGKPWSGVRWRVDFDESQRPEAKSTQ